MKKRNILVTGGAGFIGSHLINKLVSEGHNVFNMDDLSGGNRKNLNSNSKFYLCDLRDRKKTEKIIKVIKPEIVYHLAANAAENKAQFSPIDISARTYSTFINTLVPALNNGMKRFVFTSSIAVYGSIRAPFKESDRPEPEDIYGVGKLAVEQSLKILSSVHNFEYVITRPHNVYGPGQNMTDPYRNVVTIFMSTLLKGEPYFIYGDGRQRRCFSYISDVVDAIVKCGFLNVNGMIFNIGSDRNYSINELSDMVQNISGLKIKPKYIKNRPQEVKIAISNHSLAKKYLGYKNRTSLDEGLKKTWEYVKSQGVQNPIYTEIEIDSQLLPENWRRK